MRTAVVKQDLVVNVIEVESLDVEPELQAAGSIPQDAVLVESDEANIGDFYIDGEFRRPEPRETV